MKQYSLNTPLLTGKDKDKKRQEIKEYFLNTYDIYESLFTMFIDDKLFYIQPEPTRHPMIFYFGHTATFFINKLINMSIIDKRINPHFESIFAVGVDEMRWDDTNRANYSWPAVQEVREYRQKVRHLVCELIDNINFSLPITPQSDMWIVLMGIEHERIHIETSSVLHRQIPIKYIKDIPAFKICKSSNKLITNSLIDIKKQKISMGIDDSHELYSWDNEYGHHKEIVDNFKVAKYLVSNKEFYEFVKDDGYTTKRYWCEDGLKYLDNTKAKFPAFWIEDKNSFLYRGLTAVVDMPWNFPVDVNALEAKAFCVYKSIKDKQTYSLPTEAQYKAICQTVGLQNIPTFDSTKANQNLTNFSSCDIDRHNFDDIYDVVGNVWQWSSTSIFGFDGFKPHEAYDDFSTPTFDGKHSIINGSSWASSGNLISTTSRYAFREHFYQHCGFRYVINDKKTTAKKENNIYENDSLVDQYCEFQYGQTYFGVENFAVNCAKIAKQYATNTTKALDLGCATGRASFELAKIFDTVVGVDFSVRFIKVGSSLKNDGFINFYDTTEGDLKTKKTITIKQLGYEKLKDKVQFWQGDACNLKDRFTNYDLILATNLIDRLYAPEDFLKNIDKRLNKNGVLIITSPYTWQISSTKKRLWLGGYKDKNNKDIYTIDTMKNILERKFVLLHTQDMPFVIKETSRKYQHTISQVTVWRKK